MAGKEEKLLSKSDFLADSTAKQRNNRLPVSSNFLIQFFLIHFYKYEKNTSYRLDTFFLPYPLFHKK